MDVSTSPYADSPLPREAGYIRLLEVEEDGLDDVIRCKLHVFPFSEAPRYIALSYVWGTDEAAETIELNDRPFKIQSNLASFLAQYLAHQSHLSISKSAECEHPITALRGHFLWIDALCINQDDIEERGHQLGLMGDLYRTAYRVFVWLGSSSRKPTEKDLTPSDTGFHYWKIPEFNTDAQDVLGLKLWPVCRHQLDWLEPIFGDPYWKRMWVVPECFLSQKTAKLVLWNRTYCKWSDLMRLTMAIHRVAAAVSEEPRSDDESMGEALWRIRIRCLAGSPGCQFILSRIDIDHEAFPGPIQGLVRLLQNTADMECRDPHDRIYALLGLCENSIVADYRQSNEQLLAQVLSHMQVLRKETVTHAAARDDCDELIQKCDEVNRTILASLTKVLRVDAQAHVTLYSFEDPVPLRSIEPFASWLEQQSEDTRDSAYLFRNAFIARPVNIPAKNPFQKNSPYCFFDREV